MAKALFNRINFFVIIISFFFINSQNSDDKEEALIINYAYKDIKVYSIEEKDGNYKALTREVVNCFVEPCIFPILEESPIEDEEDIKILKALFDEIFENSDVKEKSVVDGDITEEQVKIILNVLEHNKISSNLEYEILGNTGKYNSKFKKRGYTYEIEDESVIYTIGMGEKNTGGYSISIQKVKIKGNSVSIYVTEKVPGMNEFVTQAFTYPIVQIKFNHLPSKVEVINYETGDIFPCLM